MNCIKCGKEIDEHANFCPFCGAAQQEEAAGRKTDNDISKQLKKNTKAIISAILATCFYYLALKVGGHVGNFLFYLFVAGLVVTYVYGGIFRLFWQALRFVAAAFDFFIVPLNFFLGIVAIFAVLIAFFFFPVVFVLADRFELKKL